MWETFFPRQRKVGVPIICAIAIIRSTFDVLLVGNKSLWDRITNLPMCIRVVESTFPLIVPNHPPHYLVLKNTMGRGKCYKTIQIFRDFTDRKKITRQVWSM